MKIHLILLFRKILIKNLMNNIYENAVRDIIKINLKIYENVVRNILSIRRFCANYNI